MELDLRIHRGARRDARRGARRGAPLPLLIQFCSSRLILFILYSSSVFYRKFIILIFI